MLGRTLLIVDDEEYCRDVIAKYFTAEQYKTHTAATFLEGIRLAEELRPDFILLDYHLQGNTAARVCAHIRSSAALKKTLIVILSGDETRREVSYSELGLSGILAVILPAVSKTRETSAGLTCRLPPKKPAPDKFPLRDSPQKTYKCFNENREE